MAHIASIGKRREQPAHTTAERLARHGLSIPAAMLRAFEKSGIYCLPGISIEHQHLARRFVLKATESGGAVAGMGRYCAFLKTDGYPVPWLQQLDSFGGNGRHAIVIAEDLIRIEMLRVERTHELLISRHTLTGADSKARPTLSSTILFRGHAGRTTHELWEATNRHLRGAIAPIFHTGAGEIHQSPEKFAEAIRKITGAVACVRCNHTHVAVPPPSDPSNEKPMFEQVKAE
jgi:hypothetical protein